MNTTAMIGMMKCRRVKPRTRRKYQKEGKGLLDKYEDSLRHGYFGYFTNHLTL